LNINRLRLQSRGLPDSVLLFFLYTKKHPKKLTIADRLSLQTYLLFKRSFLK